MRKRSYVAGLFFIPILSTSFLWSDALEQKLMPDSTQTESQIAIANNLRNRLMLPVICGISNFAAALSFC